MVPRHPNAAPGCPKECPKASQWRPEASQREPKAPQRETKGTKCRPQSTPWHFKASSKQIYIHKNSRSTAPAATMLYGKSAGNTQGASRIYLEVVSDLKSVLKSPFWVSKLDFSTRESGNTEGPTILVTRESGNTEGPNILV